jgi:tRNA(Ile)-lysidine synthase
MLLQRFKNNILSKNLFSLQSKLLIAVSGGKDSMALADLIEKLGYNYAVAHCNFCLRDKESDRDENFVQDYFKIKQKNIYTKRFNTLNYSEEKNISIQMSARELRYNWFQELLEANEFDYIITAHHLNDAIETFFINTLRGTGLNGLKGIPEKQGKIVRPLLAFNSEEIAKFITENNIPFVEDSSNREAYYLRNKLRHNVIPILKEINPQLENTFKKQLFVFNQTAAYIEEKLEEDFLKIALIHKDKTRIKCSDISNFKISELVIHYILKKFDFPSELTGQLKLMIENPLSGKIINGKNYSCLIDRDYLVFKKLSVDNTPEQLIIDKNTTELNHPIVLKFIPHDGSFINKETNCACIDADKIQFPLVLRKWEKGDYYCPIGINGKKKISDFFTNNKYSSFDKEEQWLLTSNNEIVWIVGKRIDRRFMVDEYTKKTLQVILNV